MHRPLSFNSIINTFLTAHNHWCQQSIRKRWNTLALPNYFPCALTCVCVCAHLNNLNRPDIIIFHLQLLKRAFLQAPRTHLHQRLQIWISIMTYKGGAQAGRQISTFDGAASVTSTGFSHSGVLEKLDRLTMHLVGISLFRKTLAGIQQVWSTRAKVWHHSPCAIFPPDLSVPSAATLEHVIWPLSAADFSLSRSTIKHSSGIRPFLNLGSVMLWALHFRIFHTSLEISAAYKCILHSVQFISLCWWDECVRLWNVDPLISACFCVHERLLRHKHASRFTK